ncbi:serine hydrolase [uncultured Pedobacter sp.]|uniref:serine hydrolase domain-containing protein n=1 Tax=uncultured Pedobacter sp. TaxID=246139 RepID=UPI0025D585EC|nr:serine hydrolase domain-containing protein [uncultured Pedobacter sp.]
MNKTGITALLLLISTNIYAQKASRASLDSVFTVMYNQNQFNGSVLVAEKGKVLLEKGYGFRDTLSRYPTNKNTIYELGSCSKQFTAAAIVLLHRQGLLQYDDAIDKYIPELQRWHDVTIYHLLRHTSGLPEYIGDMARGWDHRKIATNKDLIGFYAARKDTLSFKPGSLHRYNNTNYALLASIIERISGKTYAVYLKDNIFSPLKMKSTFVYNRRLNPERIQNYATGYVWKRQSFDKITSENPNYGDSVVYYLDGIVGSAKVNSTISDLYKWEKALKSNTFFTPGEFELMTEVTKTSKGKNIPYGFGLELSGGKKNLSYGHTGSWDGYASFIYHHVNKDRTIITLQNFKMGAYPFETINQILDHRKIEIEYPKKITLPDAQIAKYAGTYINKDDGEAQLISYLEGHLVHNTNKIKWDMRFFPIAENQFQGIRQGGADGVLRFTELPNQEVKLEMLEYGKVIGTAFRKNEN